MANYQAPLSLGFSRQEHWSGFPFPSPTQEGEKWKWSRSVVSDPQQPHGLQPSRLYHPWDIPGKSTGVGCHFLLQNRCIVDIKFRFVIYFHLIHLSVYVNLYLTHIPAKEHCYKERKKNWGWHFIVWLKQIVLFHLKVSPLVLRWICYL